METVTLAKSNGSMYLQVVNSVWNDLKKNVLKLFKINFWDKTICGKITNINFKTTFRGDIIGRKCSNLKKFLMLQKKGFLTPNVLFEI